MYVGKNIAMLLRQLLFYLLFSMWSFEGVRRVIAGNNTHIINGTDVTAGVGSGNEVPCCRIGDCVFHSLADALTKATSNDVINITSNAATLSSKVILEGLENIAIIGYTNPTIVQCDDIGAVKFVNCYNVTIEGINWERCGSNNESTYPGIEVHNSSGVVLQNCRFLNSTAQAVLLLYISGNVIINNCHFRHNGRHRHHGVAIYYSPSTNIHAQLVIDSSNFEFNDAENNSVVYIGGLNDKLPNYNNLCNSTFFNNKGVPIYILQNSLHLGGNVLFKGNEANNGGGIYTTGSTVTFDDKCNVSFSNNSARHRGGAIYQIHSEIFYKGRSEVTFTNNSAQSYLGGAIYSEAKSLISLTDETVVRFADNSATDYGGAIYCNTFTNISIDRNSKVHFTRNRAMQYGGAVRLFSNATISFGGNSIITFDDNSASSGGAIAGETSTILFNGKSTTTFEHNIARYQGGAVYSTINCNMTFHENSTVNFISNEVQIDGGGGAVYTWNSSNVMFLGDSIVSFVNNTARNGGAVVAYATSKVSFGDFSLATFTANTATFGGALVSSSNSSISFTGNATIILKQNNATSSGGAICCRDHCGMTLSGNSNVTFSENNAGRGSGGAVDTQYHSYIVFLGNSSVSFTRNAALYGGAARAYSNSRVSFDGFSIAKFTENSATNGGALIGHTASSLSFTGNARVMFKGNKATGDGGAIRCKGQASILLNGDSSVTFSENSASCEGGAIDARSYSNILVGGRSLVAFISNSAADAGAAQSITQSSTVFAENTIVTFVNNTAIRYGGAMNIYKSDVTFGGEAIVANNRALHGGAIYSSAMSSITFVGNSAVTLTNNMATLNGGALSLINSTIMHTGHSSVSLHSNKAKQDGGAVYSIQRSYIMLGENSTVTIENNLALQKGGAIHLFDHSLIIFEKHSKVAIHNNTAMEHGGGLSLSTQAKATFHGNSVVTLKNNDAKLNGGAIYASSNSFLTFRSDCMVTLSNNNCRLNGGALHLNSEVILSISEATLVNFHGNKAIRGGGAIYLYDHSNITIRGNSKVVLSGNNVTLYGGAVYCEGQSDMTIEENVSVTFMNNSAQQGGAVYISQARVSFEQNSTTDFTNNVAINGGALYLTNDFLVVFSYGSKMTFVNNTADRYGGVVLAELTEHVNNTNLILNTTEIDFHDTNSALVGKFIYLHVRSSCNEHCVFTSLTVGEHVMSSRPSLFGKFIITAPSNLVLQDPATCIVDNNGTGCTTYLVKNIMFGEEIILDACVLDYFGKPAVATQFLITSSDHNHHIVGSGYVLISCEALQGIRVIGNRVTETEMFSISFTSHSESQLDLKNIFVQLIVELSPCHLGFQYDNMTQRCICYSENDIVSCSDSESIIKKNYWFGVVDNITTVTICPNHYCNFTCCKTSDEFYHLSPVRINQCLSHRSGIACGGCEEGYALSFDSVKCINVNKCTTFHTVLVVTLSMIYWIAIVILVFIMTYYNSGIGYLYAITYYYSMVDILLGEHLYSSQGLFTLVSIMSSTAKVTPQFLGQLCFVKNLSGIDQQFIHYVHPLAVTVFVALICLSTRLSNRVSAFVSRGIIHVICFLLLLSYTSVATTSLLLLRSLTYHNVDKIYTYLSPDIEYCHGRHLPYVIIAILCTLVIVVCLPLLLLLEPFLNSKINFTRIKPLLDQFQGCYKDKYRSFAAFYMACRLLIILIIISNSSNDNITHYLLITINATLALIQMTFRPYASAILNIFDGLILQLLIVVSMLPLVDNVDPDLLLAFTIILVILPLLAFLIMEMYHNKATVMRITKCCATPKPDTTNDNSEIQLTDFVDSVIDDNSRRNATIINSPKKPETYDEATHYRESFMAVMNEIRDLK